MSTLWSKTKKYSTPNSSLQSISSAVGDKKNESNNSELSSKSLFGKIATFYKYLLLTKKKFYARNQQNPQKTHLVSRKAKTWSNEIFMLSNFILF